MSEYTAEVFRRSAERMDRRRRIRKRVLSCSLVCFLALGVCFGCFEIRKLFANEMSGDTVEMPGNTVSLPPEPSTDAPETPPVVITAEAPDVYGVVESDGLFNPDPISPALQAQMEQHLQEDVLYRVIVEIIATREELDEYWDNEERLALEEEYQTAAGLFERYDKAYRDMNCPKLCGQYKKAH